MNGVNLPVVVTFYIIHFIDNQMVANWYDGKYQLSQLVIYTIALYAIHANAFNVPAFQQMNSLEILIDYGLVRIHAGTFNGLNDLLLFALECKFIDRLPIDLFAPMASTIKCLQQRGWSNDVNMDEMFANKFYNMVAMLGIENVMQPQINFRILPASNFTAFCCLNDLYLYECGIQVIEMDAFDVVGRTLKSIALPANRLKDFGLFYIESARNYHQSTRISYFMMAALCPERKAFRTLQCLIGSQILYT